MMTDTKPSTKVPSKSRGRVDRDRREHNDLPILGDAEVRHIQKMLMDGKTPDEIAVALGINPHSFRWALAKSRLRIEVEVLYRRSLVRVEQHTSPVA